MASSQGSNEQGTFEELRQLVRGGKISLFVGAGVSMASGLPGWRQLVEALVERAHADAGQSSLIDEARECIRQARFIAAMTHLQEALGFPVFIKVIQAQLRRERATSAALGALADLKPACIVTTNLDALVDRSFPAYHVYTSLPGSGVAQAGEPFVWHMHGHIDEPPSWVLTEDQYHELQDSPRHVEFWRTLYMSRSFLFVGYGMDDGDFNPLVSLYRRLSQGKQQVPQHFALLPQSYSEAKRLQLKKAGIGVIQYDEADNHAGIVAALRELGGSPSAVAPRDRETPPLAAGQKHAEAPKFGARTVGALFAAAIDQAGATQDLAPALRGWQRELERPLLEHGMVAMALEHMKQAASGAHKSLLSRQTNVLLGGPTGCGKTHVAKALMLHEAALGRVVLYVGPTRALVHEVFDSFRSLERTASFDPKKDVVISTGDEQAHDGRIRAGRFKIALVVNEKASMLLNRSGLLHRLSLLVIDELHMLAREERGGVLDLLLTKIAHTNAAGEQPPIRIVGITTETALENSALVRLFEPVTKLECRTRPVTLLHRVVVAGSSHDVEKPRESDDTRIAALSRRLTESANGADGGHERALMALVHDARTRGNVIVLCAGVGVAQNRAISFCARTPQPLSPILTLEAQAQELYSRGNLGVGDKEFPKWARHGCLVHHGALHESVRRLVEQQLRVQKTGLVVFTTETLSYGVNLSARTVIFADVEFPRGDHGKENLSSVEFHNMAGRAGRPGLCDDASEAILLLRLDDARHAGNLLAVYGQSSPLQSALFSREDLRNLGPYTRWEPARVGKQTLRAILDALRFLGTGRTATGRSVTPRDVANLLAKSFYWKVNGQGDVGGGPEPGVGIPRPESGKAVSLQLIDQLLHACAAVGLAKSEEPLGTAERTYRITHKGEALIDTGTSFGSIAPMQQWIQRLNRFPATDVLPVELMIPCLTMSPDLQYAIADFCWWLGGNGMRVASQDLYQIGVWSSAALVEELRHLPGINAEDWAAEISRYLGADSHRMDGVAIGRLLFTCALLRFVRGEEVESLATTGREDKGPEDMRPRWAERASWLARMCRTYFHDEQSELRSEHARDLMELARRLGAGVPAKGLAFVHSHHQADPLSRSETAMFLKKFAEPSEILYLSEAQLDAAWLSLTGTTLATRQAQIRALAREHYHDEMLDLAAVVRGDEDDSSLPDVSGLFTPSASAPREWFPQAEWNQNEMTWSFGGKPKALTFAWLRSWFILRTAAERPADECPRLTLPAAFALYHLIQRGREFAVEKLKGMLETRRGHVRLRELVVSAVTRDFPQLQYEALLSFDEPVPPWGGR